MNLGAQPIFQIYRGGIPGGGRTEAQSVSIKRTNLRRVVVQAANLGLTHVCFHGFPRELRDMWDGLALLAADAGIQALASWGLDGETDGGKPFTGRAKGALIGEVLAKPSCKAGLLDAEGRWDDADKGVSGDVTDRNDALELGIALRAKAPQALVGDQPWFAIDSHGEVRRKPVTDRQDVFAGFPADEFGRVTNWRRFRQAYCNQASFKRQWGTTRYEKVFGWMERDWAKLELPFRQAGLPFDLGVTIQGYGWEDCPSDLIHCVLDTCVTKGQELIVWCDYAPSALVVAAVQVLNLLRTKGYALLGRTPQEVVRMYQASYNRTSPSVKLVEDGICGLKTMSTMGVVP